MANPSTSQTSAAAQAANRKLLTLIAIAILGLIVILGLAVLIAWLIIKPKHLVYTIDDGTVQNFDLSNNHLNASFDFVIRAHNPNRRISVYYDKIKVSVSHDGQTFASNTLHPFYQPRRNVTRLEAKLESRDLPLPSSFSRELRAEKANGELELDVRIKARIRYKVGVFKLRHKTLKIFCSPVMVQFSKSKNFQTTYCDLDY